MAENFEEAKRRMMEDYGNADAPMETPTETPTEAPTNEMPEAPTETPVENPNPQNVQNNAPPQMPDYTEQLVNALNNATNQVQMYQQKQTELENLIAEMNKAKEEEVYKEAEEQITPPEALDMSKFDYMSDEEKSTAFGDYINKRDEYLMKMMDKKYQPYVDRANREERFRQEDALINDMSREDSGLQDFARYSNQVREIVHNNPMLANSDNMENAYVTAYLMARGNEARNAQPKNSLDENDLKMLTNEQFASLYDNNPEFQKAVAMRMQENLRNGQSVPTFSAGGDNASGGSANVEESAKDFKTAFERMKARYNK